MSLVESKVREGKMVGEGVGVCELRVEKAVNPQSSATN